MVRFNSTTQRQMFLLLYGSHLCVAPRAPNMASPYKALNLDKTLLRITREVVYIFIIYIIYRMVTIFRFDHMSR